MIKRISALTLTLVVMTAFFGTRALAKTSGDELKPATENSSASRKADEVNKEKFRIAFDKLVADAKAGRVAPAPRPQIRPAMRNNLSQGAKIAIVAGVVAAVVAIIIISKRDDFGPRGPIPVF